MISKGAAMTTVSHLWRRRRTYASVARNAAVSGTACVTFVRFMYGALKNGKFTGGEEAEGRKRWVAVYDGMVGVLRSIPGLKR